MGEPDPSGGGGNRAVIAVIVASFRDVPMTVVTMTLTAALLLAMDCTCLPSFPWYLRAREERGGGIRPPSGPR